MEKLSDFHTWGKVPFVHPDYEYINKCAYFDYQRDRVYIRTSKTLRKRRAGKEESKSDTQSVPTRRDRGRTMPCVQGKDLIRGVKKQVRTQEPRVKRAFDLVLTPSGVKRKVIACRTSVHQCLQCGTEFVPDHHQRLDKHFHGLKSWAMFQHILPHQPGNDLQNGGGVFRHTHFLVGNAHVQVIYGRILQDDIPQAAEEHTLGHLLHVDETEVKLQQGKAMSGCLRTSKKWYTCSDPIARETFCGAAQGFSRGVSLGLLCRLRCSGHPQQKCLIHLMRDLNQELLDNPYDAELKAITTPLAACYVRLSKPSISTGCSSDTSQSTTRRPRASFGRSPRSFSSEAAEALRARLLKYQEKLFTFIHHDGVPWNNNNAEHAIKQFAYYRERPGCCERLGSVITWCC